MGAWRASWPRLPLGQHARPSADRLAIRSAPIHSASLHISLPSSPRSYGKVVLILGAVLAYGLIGGLMSGGSGAQRAERRDL